MQSEGASTACSFDPRHVFVYGTLLLPEIQRRVTGRAFEAEPALLRGYARRTVRGEVYPSVLPCAGDVVDGALLRGVDAASLARLDAYEGAPYERVRVRVERAAGGAAEAWMWLLRPSERALLSDEPWDLATFLGRDRARFEAGYAGFGAPEPGDPG
ncbi:MAG: gamma-glutamylcyclotransferase family protein [Planctomycetota bacterium]